MLSTGIWHASSRGDLHGAEHWFQEHMHESIDELGGLLKNNEILYRNDTGISGNCKVDSVTLIVIPHS